MKGDLQSGMNTKAADGSGKEKKPYLHLFLLSIAAVVWGASFVSQSVGMDHVGPFTYNGVRMLMGGTVVCEGSNMIHTYALGDRKSVV